MTAETPTPRPEDQCCAATVEEMCAGTLAHYDDISTKACHWNNQVPQAIRFWYLEKPKLERSLQAAEARVREAEKALAAARRMLGQINYSRNMRDDDPMKGPGNYLADALDAYDAVLTKEKKDA